MSAADANAGPIVFIDGECLLCNRAVSFLVARDHRAVLRFAHLQGPLAAARLPADSRDVGPDGAVVLLEPDRGDRVSLRSLAILRLLGRLEAPWTWLAPLAAVPGLPRLLDVAYRFVARRRDHWFGRAATCLMPDAALRARFADPVLPDVAGDVTAGRRSQTGAAR